MDTSTAVVKVLDMPLMVEIGVGLVVLATYLYAFGLIKPALVVHAAGLAPLTFLATVWYHVLYGANVTDPGIGHYGFWADVWAIVVLVWAPFTVRPQRK